MYIGKTNIVKIGEHYFWKKLRTFKFTKSPNLGVKVRIWAVVLGYLQGSKLFYYIAKFYYVFPIYDIKLHHICSTSNLVQPPFNVISIVSMWWKLFMLRKIFQSSNFSLFSKEKGKVVWLTYLIIFNLVCIWILWNYQIFYTVLWLISMSSSIFVFLIISWFS